MRASGLSVEDGNYPGDRVVLAKLAPALRKLADSTPFQVALLAPQAMPAETLVPVVAAAATVSTVYLSANAPGSPEGWDLPGTVPIALTVKGADAYIIAPKLTVQNLAVELARRVKTGQKAVALSVKRNAPSL